MLRSTKLRLTVSLLLCFVLQSLGADNYNNNNGQTYEFGFKIDGEQHRHESKDKDGIIMGEFGFVTADDVYHVTVYATDKEGRFKILSMKNIHLKSSPASSTGGFLSTRQNNTRKGKEISPLSVSTEKPKGSCASCSKIEDLPQKPTPSPNYNNSPNQFGTPGTGPQNKQVFTPSHNPYEQQYTSPAGPSVSFNNNSPNQFGTPGTGPQNEQVFTPSHNPYEQQYTSPAGPSVSLKNNSPNQFGTPGTGPQNEQVFTPSHNPYEQQYTSPAGPSVSLNNNSLNQFGTTGTGPQNEQVFTHSPNPYEQQYTSPAGPSVSLNNNSPNQFGTTGTGPQNEQVFTHSPNPYEQQYTSPDGPSVSINNKNTGGRTPKQLEPNGSRGPVGVPNQGRPPKPTLVNAQIQIVDKNTDIYALGPNEMKGLPPGLSSDDITTLLYTFNYTVGFHGHFEEGYTNGVKKGYYFVTGRNGVRTRIDYIADDTGFHPTITNDILDLLSEDVPKPETEKDEKYGLKGYEFKWLFYPVESKRH